LEQVIQGLNDGQWEPTDEVMGPDDPDWTHLESHPATAEVAAELEPPPPRTYDDETRLDMTPLIDVCLVLLVFFILTTTAAALQKLLEAPAVSADKPTVAVVTKEQVAEQMIVVKAKMENGEVVIRVEDQVVDPARLLRELRAFARASKKSMLLFE